MTVGILAVRTPPRRADLTIAGIGGVAVLLYVALYVVTIAIGLALPGPAGGSDNPYLRPDNAFRIAKGFFAALALLPFLLRRQRTHADAVALFGVGMLAGLSLVAIAALIERALFPGIFNFTSDYRIVATFSSMHLGGGHIGAYLAMALPFVVVGFIRPSPAKVVAMLLIVAMGGYTLVVTFARTAYAATLIAMAVVLLGWIVTAARRRNGTIVTAVFAVIVCSTLGVAVITATFDTPYMFSRLEAVVPDLAMREYNWRTGIAQRDGTIEAVLFGMGLGTYPRVVLAHSRKGDDHAPTNFVAKRAGEGSFLSIATGLTLYFVQRVSIDPDQSYKFSAKLRSPDGKGTLSALLCENMLLYSDNCHAVAFVAPDRGDWQEVTANVSAAGLDQRILFGWMKRPVGLSLFGPVPGTTIDIEDVKLIDLVGPQRHCERRFRCGHGALVFRR